MNTNNQPLLSVRDLKVYFHGRDDTARAVDGVSYDVGEGETVCLVGESGCGKTVSALTVLGLVPRPPGEIVSGQVLFKGKDILRLKETGVTANPRQPDCHGLSRTPHLAQPGFHHRESDWRGHSGP